MGLQFILETYSFATDPPTPVTVTISWEYTEQGGEYYYLVIEKRRVNRNDDEVYHSLKDGNLRAPLHLYYLSIFEKWKIYIPFEIYENFENYNICSEEGFARWKDIRQYPIDISIPAVAIYPGENRIHKYYKYFEKLITGLSHTPPPLDGEQDSDDESDIEDDEKLPINEDAQPADSSITFLPRKFAKDDPKFDLLQAWEAQFLQLDQLLKCHYMNDLSAQENAFIYMALLYTNNANFSSEEKKALSIPSNPLQNLKNHSYLRTNKNSAVFDRCKEIFNIDKSGIFISVDANRLRTIFSHYFKTIVPPPNFDEIKLDSTNASEELTIIFFASGVKYTTEQIESYYAILAQKIKGNSTNQSIDEIKKLYVICYVEKIAEIYVLRLPNADIETGNRLNVITSLGYVPDIIKFYRSIFRQFIAKTNKDDTKNEATVFNNLWLNLSPNLRKKKASSAPASLIPNPDIIKKIEAILSQNNLNNIYWQFTRLIFAKLEILNRYNNQNFLMVYMFETFYLNLQGMAQATNLDDFLIAFQAYLDTLLFFMNVNGSNIDFSNCIRSLLDQNDKNLAKPQIITLCNYGMCGFSYVLEALFSCLTPKEITVFNQAYFELLNNMDNLNATVIRLKYTDDISQQTDLIFIDLHPNNAVETELYSHQIRKIFERLYPDYKRRLSSKAQGPQFYQHKVTVVIDATLNILGDSELTTIINELAPLIDAGLINLILIQSLTKFAQLAADKLSAGAIIVFNNNNAHWANFNYRLSEYSQDSSPDQLINYYFTCFYLTHNLLFSYRNQVAQNTRYFYNEVKDQLYWLMTGDQLLQMDITESIDNNSCYVSFNYRNLTAQIYRSGFVTDNDITKFNKVIITTITELAKTFGILLTKRQSIGFGTCNINECDFAIRLTIGLESIAELKKLADLFVFICYALTSSNADLKNKDALSFYLADVKQIFYACYSNQSPAKNASADIKLAKIKIDEKIPRPATVLPNNAVRIDIDHRITEVTCCLEKSGEAIYAESAQQRYPVVACWVNSNTGKARVTNSKDCLPITRALLSLFIRNHVKTGCKLSFDISNNLTSRLVEITNFIDLLNPSKKLMLINTQKYGKLQFMLRKNQLTVSKNGRLLLIGSQVDIHRDVLENFGIAFPQSNNLAKISAAQLEADREVTENSNVSERANPTRFDIIGDDDPYIAFDQLPEQDRKHFFMNLPKMGFSIENHLHPVLKQSLPCKFSIEKKTYRSDNGIILEYVFSDNESTKYKATLTIFAIKPPILNLYCLYMCLLAIYSKVSNIELAKGLNYITFDISNCQPLEAARQFSIIVKLFLKLNREIRNIFITQNNASPLSILMRIKALFDKHMDSALDDKTFENNAHSILPRIDPLTLNTNKSDQKPTASLDEKSGKSAVGIEQLASSLLKGIIAKPSGTGLVQKSKHQYTEILIKLIKRHEVNTFDAIDDLTKAKQISREEFLKKVQAEMGTFLEASGLKIEDVPPDGNCFFHAVRDQLQQRLNLTYTVDDLRVLAAGYILDHPDEFRDVIQALNSGNISEYLQKLFQDREWADNLIIFALSKAMKIELIIINNNLHDLRINSDCDDKIGTLYLGYYINLHYFSLRGNAQNITKTNLTANPLLTL